MPPPIALFLTIAFVVYLFRRDAREKPRITGALWLPLIWMLIIGSRFVSQWLNAGAPADLEDGSPIDRAVFLILLLAGMFVLAQRRVSWPIFFSRNIALVLFLMYGLLTVSWSDFPFIAFRRWVKILGHPVMALIVLTEPDPREATIRLMKRAAYVLVPFSITLIKYYPGIGRGFSHWSGAAFNIGVATDKNALGCVCLILGFFFFWHFLTHWHRQKSLARRNELLLSTVFLCMIAWLIYKADSATSLMALLVGMATVLFLGRRSVNKAHIGMYFTLSVVVFLCIEFVFGATNALIQAAGRDPTLTGRTDLWEDLLRFDINPLIGVGFESFWLGERLEWLWNKYWWRPNHAHNGYLELYLNLGVLGVIVVAVWIISAFRKAQRTLLSDFDFGRFCLGLIAIVVVYNYTEATFKAVHLVWFVFYLIAIDYPRAPASPPPRRRFERRARPALSATRRFA